MFLFLLNLCFHEVRSSEIENALSKLVESGFLTQTGAARNVLFVHEPIIAHTFGTICSNPSYYSKPKEIYGREGQLGLPY